MNKTKCCRNERRVMLRFNAKKARARRAIRWSVYLKGNKTSMKSALLNLIMPPARRGHIPASRNEGVAKRGKSVAKWKSQNKKYVVNGPSVSIRFQIIVSPFPFSILRHFFILLAQPAFTPQTMGKTANSQ